MATAKWTVRLVKKTKGNLYKKDYFPRSFALKKDALALIKTVEENGGEAVCEKAGVSRGTLQKETAKKLGIPKKDAKKINFGTKPKSKRTMHDAPTDEDLRNRTPDSELDLAELEDQPEEVEKNRLHGTAEELEDLEGDQDVVEAEKRPDPTSSDLSALSADGESNEGEQGSDPTIQEGTTDNEPSSTSQTTNGEQQDMPKLSKTYQPPKTTKKGISPAIKALKKELVENHKEYEPPHVMVDAKAGTGKTFTLIVGIINMFGDIKIPN